MYEFDSRVRYSETDIDGNLMIGSIADYFQDCTHFELDDLGVGERYLLSHNQGWFIYFWQIDIECIPRRGETVTIGTFPYQVAGMTAHRNYYIKGKNGKSLVKANSVWSLVDLERMQIVKIPKEITENYQVEQCLDMEYLSRRIKYEASCRFTEVGKHTVSKQQLDSNRHLNNSQYIQLALSYIMLSNDQIKRVCVEYKKQAVLGDLIKVYLYCYEDGKASIVDLRTEQGDSYATVLVEHADAIK
ncbi:MAG: acyl-[acyl-carrier-protein] thioesterase [Roseburia sp.]